MSTIYKTPDVAALQAALRTVDDNGWLDQKIYPKVAKELAGREISEVGIPMAFQLASFDAWEPQGNTGPASMVYSMRNDEFIEAIKKSSTPIKR